MLQVTGTPNNALRLTAKALGSDFACLYGAPRKSEAKGETQMYANTVTLIGFLGSDPDRRETKNNNSSPFSRLQPNILEKQAKPENGNLVQNGTEPFHTGPWPTLPRP